MALFEGRLTGNVYLTWFSSVLRSRYQVGLSRNRSEWAGQRLIGLNACYFLLDAAWNMKQLVEVLIHEMIVSWRLYPKCI